MFLCLICNVLVKLDEWSYNLDDVFYMYNFTKCLLYFTKMDICFLLQTVSLENNIIFWRRQLKLMNLILSVGSSLADILIVCWFLGHKSTSVLSPLCGFYFLHHLIIFTLEIGNRIKNCSIKIRLWIEIHCRFN